MSQSFRADHVGSLLRTTQVKENRNLWKEGKLSAEELRNIEDAAIAETVKRVEATGMQAITDGEFRRDYFHLDFLKELSGVSVTAAWVRLMYQQTVGHPLFWELRAS